MLPRRQIAELSALSFLAHELLSWEKRTALCIWRNEDLKLSLNTWSDRRRTDAKNSSLCCSGSASGTLLPQGSGGVAVSPPSRHPRNTEIYQAASTPQLYCSDKTNVMKYQENLSANLPKIKSKQGTVDRSTSDSQNTAMQKSHYKDMPKPLYFQALPLAGATLSAPLPLPAPGRLCIPGNSQGMGAALASTSSTPGQLSPACKSRPGQQPGNLHGIKR